MVSAFSNHTFCKRHSDTYCQCREQETLTLLVVWQWASVICLPSAFFLSLLVELGLVTFGHMRMVAFPHEPAMPMALLTQWLSGLIGFTKGSKQRDTQLVWCLWILTLVSQILYLYILLRIYIIVRCSVCSGSSCVVLTDFRAIARWITAAELGSHITRCPQEVGCKIMYEINTQWASAIRPFRWNENVKCEMWRLFFHASGGLSSQLTWGHWIQNAPEAWTIFVAWFPPGLELMRQGPNFWIDLLSDFVTFWHAPGPSSQAASLDVARSWHGHKILQGRKLQASIPWPDRWLRILDTIQQ